MQHDDDVRATPQSFAIAGFLVAAISQILAMYEGGQPEFGSDFRGGVVAAVIHKNNFVHEVFGDFAIGLFKRLCGVIRRHHDENAFSVEHRRLG